MPAPVKPADFEKLIVQPEDTLAAAIIKTYVRLPVLLFKLFSYMFTSGKTLSTAFSQDICDLNCNQEET